MMQFVNLQLRLQHFVHQNFAFAMQFCYPNYWTERQWVSDTTRPRIIASSQISLETQKDTKKNHKQQKFSLEIVGGARTHLLVKCV